MKNQIFRPLCAVICAALLTGCSGAAGTGSGTAENAETSETEESEVQTLTVSDMDYYTRFKGQNLSINVYNWGCLLYTSCSAFTGAKAVIVLGWTILMAVPVYLKYSEFVKSL